MNDNPEAAVPTESPKMSIRSAMDKWSECCAVIKSGDTYHRQDNWRPLDRALRKVDEVQPEAENVIQVKKAGATFLLMVR